MKRIFSILLAIVLTVGIIPNAVASASYKTENTYSKNDGKVYFSAGYAQVGVPISVKTNLDGTDFLYKWYIDKKQLDVTGDSYTPVEADIESMLTAEVYSGDGELFGSVNMLVSKLPVVYIETEDREPLNQKSKVLKAHMTLQGNDEFSDESVLYDGEVEIKGRGNSTWMADKKPYKLKLDTKSDLLGMGKNKHWVLLSNPYDKSLSRNKLIYDLAEDMGLDAMSSQWVDVVLNGKTVGNYLLCEHVRIGSTRVDITDWDDIADEAAKAIYKANKKSMSKDERGELAELMEANMDWVTDGSVTYKGKTYKVSDYYNLPDANGGYLLECFGSENPGFISGSGYGVCISKPEGIGKGMLSEIQAYYSAFEQAAQAADFCAEYNGKRVRYSELADAESFARGFLLNEIFQNQDFMSRSTYMYKDVDGKLVFGPVWDMDMSTDNSTNVYAHNKWTCFTRGYIMGMLKDPAFLKIVYDTYREYRYTAIADMLKPDGDIDKVYEKIYDSAVKNDMLWGGNPDFKTDIEHFRLWLSRRIDWIDNRAVNFETFYASVNGTALNNSGSTTLELNGSRLAISMNDSNVANCKVLVNGTETAAVAYKKLYTLNIGTLPAGSVVSAMSYDKDGNFLGMSTVTTYSEPVSLKLTKAPSRTEYSTGEKIDLSGAEVTAVYSDKTEKIVEPEAVLSYVEDCIGEQSLVYNRITDKIGKTYISLRYRGVKVDYKVDITAGEDAEKVEALIERLPQSNIENNLEIIFEAKQEYDALSDSAKLKVKNASRLERIMKKIDGISEKSDTPILGCYIDRIGRTGKKNSVVVIAKGKPNKIRFFNGGSVTTIPVENREYCIAVKNIAGYNIMTIPYYLGNSSVEVGAYYNHVLQGELYKFDTAKQIENCSGMVKKISYEKHLPSVDDTAVIDLTVSSRVEMITATCDGIEFPIIPESGKASVEINFTSSGAKQIDLTYYSDEEAHFYKTVQVYVGEKTTPTQQLALQYPTVTADDEAEIYVATSQDIKAVKLVSGSQSISLKSVIKNGYKVWQYNVKMDSNKSFKLYVDSKYSGRTISIQKTEKLVIVDGMLTECRAKKGTIDVPYTVTAVADGAFDGFKGTIRCYANSAAQKYAEKNGISYTVYGYTLNVPDEIRMNKGDIFAVSPIADPIVPPDFSMKVTLNNSAVLADYANGFEAVKAGYARVQVVTNDGLKKEIKVYVGGGCTKGDINADGKINAEDSLIILRYAVGLTELNSEEKAAGDINGDNSVNSFDALIALQITTGSSSIWNFV